MANGTLLEVHQKKPEGSLHLLQTMVRMLAPREGAWWTVCALCEDVSLCLFNKELDGQ